MAMAKLGHGSSAVSLDLDLASFPSRSDSEQCSRQCPVPQRAHYVPEKRLWGSYSVVFPSLFSVTETLGDRPLFWYPLGDLVYVWGGGTASSGVEGGGGTKKSKKGYLKL